MNSQFVVNILTVKIECMVTDFQLIGDIFWRNPFNKQIKNCLFLRC